MRDRPFWSWGHRLGLFRAFAAGAPLWCAWQVTYRCNMRCRFCHYWRVRSPASEELASPDFDRGARNLGRLGTLIVSLAGGEPLLRDDLEAVIQALARRHIVFVTTNGMGLSAQRARGLWQAGLWGASISIDYADPDRHDRARGRPGAFHHAVQALARLSESRTAWFQQVNLMAVLMHDNVDDLEALALLARRHRANFMVQPYSAAKTGCREFLPRRPVSAHLLALKRRQPNFLSNRWFLARFDEYLNGGVPDCGAGRRFFNVDHRGRVSRCVEEMDRTVGSLLEEPIDVLLRRLRRRQHAVDCRACWYNCRGETEALFTARGLLESLPTYLAGPLRTLWDRPTVPGALSGQPDPNTVWTSGRKGHQVPSPSRADGAAP